MVDEVPIGRRMAYWRGRRKLSQQQLADRLGMSKSWVDKVERGARRLDKLSVLGQVADALRVDVQLLLGRAPAGAGDVAPGFAELRDTLALYDVTLPGCAPEHPPVLGEVRKDVTHAWGSFQRARYDDLVRVLPRTLQAAQRLRASDRSDPAAAGLLGEVYQIVSVVAAKLGEPGCAQLAADRAMAVCADGGDRVWAARAALPLAGALLAGGRHRRAVEVSVAVAHRLAVADRLDASVGQVSVYGALLLAGAVAAARCGDEPTAEDLLTGAAHAAERVSGVDNRYWTGFGSAAVALARIRIAVEFGDGKGAVAAQQALAGSQAWRLLVPQCRAGHLVELARGHLQLGETRVAGRAVLAAERIASGEVRSRPMAHDVLSGLLRLSPRPDPQVATLAEELGVRV